MRGLAANLAGKGWRHVGQVFLPCPTHLLKHPRQKLCWHGACTMHTLVFISCFLEQGMEAPQQMLCGCPLQHPVLLPT